MAISIYYIKESHVKYTIYNSRLTEPIRLKIGGVVTWNQDTDIRYFLK